AAARPTGAPASTRLSYPSPPSIPSPLAPDRVAVPERGSLASHAALPRKVRRTARAAGPRTRERIRMAGMSGARTALERIAATAVSWPLLSRLVGRLAD